MAKSREVTDQMFTAAAKALAGCVSNEQLEIGRLYPEVHDIRDVSATVRYRVTYI